MGEALWRYKGRSRGAQFHVIRTAKYVFLVLYQYVPNTYLAGHGMESHGKRQASPEITRCCALKCARSDGSAATGAVRVAGGGCRTV